MNNKGFALIETLITTVVLITSLLIVYGAYRYSFYDEVDRIKYDNIDTIYQTHYLKEFLNDNTNISNIKNNMNNNQFITIGAFTDGLGKENVPNYSNLIMRYYNINGITQVILINGTNYNNCIKNNNENCYNEYLTINKELTSYLKSLNLENNKYYLAVEYSDHINSKDFNLLAKYQYANIEI